MIPTETRIYKRAIELCDIVCVVVESMPRRQRSLADQLQRASSAVTLQFVEGFSQQTARHRLHYFRIAMGSANECAAALDIARRWGLIDAELARRGIDAAGHVAAMLCKFR